MNEGMSGERGVVGFDVEPEIFVEPVLLKKRIARRGVAVILVLGGLFGFGLDVELALEADLCLYSTASCRNLAR